MLVAQAHLQRPGPGQPAGRLGAFQFDEKGRDIAPPLGGCDSEGITHEPKVTLGLVLWREGPARLRPSHYADQFGIADELAAATRRGVLPSLRDKAPIDHDEPAGRKPGG